MRRRPAKPVALRNRKNVPLSESEITYREIFDSTSDAIFLHCAATGNIIDLNKAALRMFGWRSKKEVIEKTVGDLSSSQPPFTRKEAIRHIRLAASGKPQVFEWMARKQNGTTFWVEISLRASKVRKLKSVLAVVRDIGERKRAEEALRESEERFRSIVNATTEWIWEMDLRGRHTYSNPIVRAILGYEPEEFLGNKVSSLLHPEDRREVETRLPGLMAEKRGWKGWILRWRHKDGSYRFLESNAEPIVDSKGRIQGYRGADRDVTERERAGEALRESESQLRQLWEATVEGIMIHDQGKILEVNDAMCRLFRVTSEQVIGRSLLEFAPPESRDRIQAHFASGSLERYETPAVRSDGTRLTLEVTAKPLQYRGKSVRMVTCRDISERKTMEEELRKSEERYRRFFEGDLSGVYLSTPEGRILACNDAFVKIAGYDSKEDLLRVHASKFYTSKGIRAEFLERLRQKRRLVNEESELLRKDGRRVHIVENVIGVFDERDELVEFRGYIFDISERRWAEERQASILKAVPLVLYAAETPSPFDATWISENTKHVTGFSHEHFLNQEGFWSSRVHPDDKERVADAFARIREGREMEVEYRWLCANGSYRWFLDKATIVRQSAEGRIEYSGIWLDVTERKQAEEALRESEEIFHQFLEHSPIYVFFKDENIRSTRLSRNYETMLGRPISELLGKSMDDLFPSDLAKSMIADDRRILTEGKRVEVEEEMNGRHYSTIKFPITIKGKPRYLAGFTIDITERKQSELALAKLKQAIDTSGEAVFMTDREGLLTYVNPGFTSLYGYSAQEVIGKATPRILKSGAMNTSTYVEFWKTLSSGREVRKEFVNKCKGGRLVEVDGSATPIVDENKNIIGYLGIQRDITERKNAEKALRENEEKFRIAFDNAPTGMSIIQPDGTYVEVNPYLCQMFGYSREELLSGTINRITHPDDIEPGNRWIRKMISGDLSQPEFEKRYVHKDGHIVWGLVRARWIRNADGSPRMSIAHVLDITERKRAEEALRESENRMKSIFRAAPTGIGSVSNRVLTEVNAKLCEMTGYEQNELIGRSARTLYPTQEEFEYVGTEKYRQISEQGTGTVETRWQRKDGSIIDVLLSSTPIDPWDLTHGVTFTALDITERKRAEEALKQYQLLSQHTRDIILIVNASDGRILEANDAAVRSYGFSRTELVKKTVRDLRAPGYVRELPEQLMAASQDGLAFETVHRRHDGSSFPVEVSSRGMTLGQDRILMSIVRDITERKKAEETLANERSLLRTVIDTMPDPIFVKDLQGRKIIANKAEAQFCGKEAVEEVLGRSDEDLYPADIADHVRREEQQLLGRPQGRANYEGKYTFPDGKEHWMVGIKIVLRDAKGEPFGILGVSHDITDRKRMEEERQKMDQQIQQSQKLESLGLLAGGIAHDFNNLLSGIFGFVELAKKNIDEGDRAKASDRLLKALNVFSRARDLSRQLITFSKGGAPAKITGDIGRTLSETVQFALSGSNVKCEYDIPPNLWICSYDPNQVSQVIDNIVINAKHAMPHGGLLEVTAANAPIDAGSATALRSGNYVKISIRDHGIGIPEEYLQKIFDPFFTTKHTGSGLGLATCWSIVRRHDGTIMVESEPGKGSTFHIYLPVAHDAATPEGSGSESEFVGHGNVLIMDDEEHIREILEEMLTDLGYAVQTARDGAEAIEVFKKAKAEGKPFDLVMVDLTIPGGMGGKETMKRLVKLEEKLRVIASSGYSEDPVISAPREFGFAASIRKPYRKTELIETLKKSLSAGEERNSADVPS